ncbi:uncharacterized protein THITE_158355 [Thermothielavioides terrestris NRRL 8126]|uniref:Uncharacterized protein n=1 Tax=Thermothielavioides terrestris (strain ATCC 38088 / NRRL 8126) TaxID=578455 RepID=G2QTL8_THETT|nr:uncharacterized protein THITE_158355 [Thermothielavioides terrestris NRRL 8126]AEO64437.1 hypothetical protein THITE_158355 [Thermothielavioides terrestris NRRL 8126]
MRFSLLSTFAALSSVAVLIASATELSIANAPLWLLGQVGTVEASVAAAMKVDLASLDLTFGAALKEYS